MKNDKCSKDFLRYNSNSSVDSRVYNCRINISDTLVLDKTNKEIKNREGLTCFGRLGIYALKMQDCGIAEYKI